jgi:hypothetical protein
MAILKEMGTRLSTAGELMGFLWRNKLWWLSPVVIVLLVMGLLIGFGTATGVGPFIYTLF